MLVYRVEHQKNSLGPYTNCACSMERHYCNDEYCPAPDADGIDKWQFEDAHYGFKDKKSLVRWFGREYLREFSYQGLHVYSFRVSEEWVSKGNRHLAFESSEAVKVKKIPLYSLH